MTNTTQQVDLSTLEHGDTVVFIGENTASVAHVNKRKYDTVLHLGFKNGTVSKIRYTFFGQPMYYQERYRIKNIIKNPKRWTDEDMKAAFNDSIVQMHKKGFTDFGEWLDKYKELKYGCGL